MVDEYRDIMAFMDIFAHINILRRKRRGIQPEEIKFGNLNLLAKIQACNTLKSFPISSPKFNSYFRTDQIDYFVLCQICIFYVCTSYVPNVFFFDRTVYGQI